MRVSELTRDGLVTALTEMRPFSVNLRALSMRLVITWRRRISSRNMYSGMSGGSWMVKRDTISLGEFDTIHNLVVEAIEIVNQTRTNIRTLYYKTRNAFRQVELYEKDLLPQAMRALEVSETWFREGEGAFTDVLESQSAVYNFQLSLARAKSDIGKNIAQLERLLGASISELSQKGGSQ